ncbi:hypothetical protein PsorP6_002437 [Peronosclerospora sorghi]|uniref:Uncharacterized protein n=1 Tax=Peronosclerospora sorghi TaxID=230839 RepID=A0ACC0WV85_9STRA|nr:hypothetical protein PsorP6_002437 [Peronosclerospora sorghi]
MTDPVMLSDLIKINQLPELVKPDKQRNGVNRSHVADRFAHNAEKWHRDVDRIHITTNHDRERSFASTNIASRYWRIKR